MQPNVPVPTDNLYKLMALFGLVLIISALFTAAYVHVNVNNKHFSYVDVYYGPTTRNEPDQAEFKKHIESQVDALHDGSELAMSIAGGALAIGGWLCILGFKRWAKIQPLHDELLELQIAKARKEVHGSNVYRELPKQPKPKKATKE